MRNASVSTGILTLLITTVLSATEPVDNESFPYTGYVNSQDVYVRSGPGRDYYPTEKLQAGTPVEVYRHDPGGWLAIRPTEQSFSWVSSRHVSPTSDGLGEVTDERVASRVGSLFSNVRDVTQVRLKRGEVVEILDEHNAGGQTWYKITPPSGEFRWISGRFVEQDKPHDGVSKPRRRSSRHREREPRVRTPLASSEEDPTRSNKQVATQEMPNRSEIQKASWDAPVREQDLDHEEEGDQQEPPIRIASEEESEHHEDRADAVQAANWEDSHQPSAETDKRKRTSRGSRSTVSGGKALSGKASSRESASRAVPTQQENVTFSAEEFQAELNRLDNQLSQMVAEEPTVWHFENLSSDLESMFEAAGTAIERGKVRRVLSKVARFKDIRSRYQKVNQVQAETDRHNGELDATLSRNREVKEVSGDSRNSGVRRVSANRPQVEEFDGVGTLRPVISRRAGAPPYALLDERGEVQWFVSPSPGLNLQSMLGRKIGVSGTRGYMPEYGRPYVMARRFQQLESKQQLKVHPLQIQQARRTSRETTRR